MATGNIFDIGAIIKDAGVGAVIGLIALIFHYFSKSGQKKKDQPENRNKT